MNMHEDTLNAEPPDTSFVPQLDARQRAMLAEMGVRVWAPKPKPVALPVAAEAAAVSAAPAPASVASGLLL